MPPWTLPKVHASGPGQADLTPHSTAGPATAGATGPEPPVGPGLTGTGPDWATQAVDRIDEVVETIRSNTTDRLVRVARWVVFGLLVAILALTAGILIVISLIRVLDELVPGDVWIVYSGLGAIFTAGGVLLWSMRTPRRPLG